MIRRFLEWLILSEADRRWLAKGREAHPATGEHWRKWDAETPAKPFLIVPPELVRKLLAEQAEKRAKGDG
jgi:hypothetical protein